MGGPNAAKRHGADFVAPAPPSPAAGPQKKVSGFALYFRIYIVYTDV
jgi:hypothetical protein